MSIVEKDFGKITSNLSVDGTTEVIQITDFFDTRQVVGNESIGIPNSNIAYTEGGTVIEFKPSGGLTGGTTVYNEIIDINSYDATTRNLTVTSNKYSMGAMEWSNLVVGMLAIGGMVFEANKGKSWNEFCDDAWRFVRQKVFRQYTGDEKADLQAFYDANGISYTDYEVIQAFYSFLEDSSMYKTAHPLDYDNINLGDIISTTPLSASAFNMACTRAGIISLGISNAYKLLSNAIGNHGNAFSYNAVNVRNEIYTFSIGAYALPNEAYAVNSISTDTQGNRHISIQTEYEGYWTATVNYDVVNNIWSDVAFVDGQGVHGNATFYVNPFIIENEASKSATVSSFSSNNASLLVQWLRALIGGKLIEIPDEFPLEFPDFHIFELGKISPAWVSNPSLDLRKSFKIAPVPFEMPELDPANEGAYQKQAQEGKNPWKYPYPPYDPYINVYPEVEPTPNPIVIEIPNPPTDITIPANPQPTPPQEPTEPSKPTPTPVVPIDIGGNATALFTVYNPAMSNLNALGRYLWSTDAITQLVKMFSNNPLDAVISLQVNYATPITGRNSNIVLGYLDAGSATNCPLVTNQYSAIDCGNVGVAELYGDARDYSPFTNVSIYLPFIGFRDLKTEDVMGGIVNVKYNVDVLTGTCLATVTITKKNVSQTLYTFEGNCATDYPLTGADHSRMISALASVGIGYVTGGAIGAGIAGASALGNGSMKPTIQRSGGFSGNAGAMSIKKPYIIVNRCVGYDAYEYNKLYGYPANTTVYLRECNGYTRVKDVHVDEVNNATEDEKKEIEVLLKAGVIIN